MKKTGPLSRPFVGCWEKKMSDITDALDAYLDARERLKVNTETFHSGVLAAKAENDVLGARGRLDAAFAAALAPTPQPNMLTEEQVQEHIGWANLMRGLDTTEIQRKQAYWDGYSAAMLWMLSMIRGEDQD